MNTPDIAIDQFDYPLPDERIARHPLARRDSCKLLVRNADGSIYQHLFHELPALLPDGAMMVCNNTKVINARLRFRKGADRSGALIEIFCLEPADHADFALTFAATDRCCWNCFVGNSKRWKEGTLSLEVTTASGTAVELEATRRSTGEGGVSAIDFAWSAADGSAVSFSEVIDAAGEIPIPPYLNRNTEASDLTDYQTVFSHIEGSVAAPTAGLHFTPELLTRLAEAGIERRELTLHVGAGTFQPVKTGSIADHEMHSEFIAVERGLIAELAVTDRPVVAVGTTSVRTLESIYHLGCMVAQGLNPDGLPQWYAYSGNHPGLSRRQAMEALLSHLDSKRMTTLLASTRMIIAPGYAYRMVNEIITNFHQPRSTLLLLVSAFTGGDWRSFYDYALENDFRFLSYGDACLLKR